MGQSKGAIYDTLLDQNIKTFWTLLYLKWNNFGNLRGTITMVPVVITSTGLRPIFGLLIIKILEPGCFAKIIL